MTSIANKSFKPTRGKVAIKKDQFDEQTSTGIYYKPREDVKYTTGIVAAIGSPKINDQGIEMPIDVTIGERVVIERKYGYTQFGGFMIVDHDAIICAIGPDMKVGDAS